ncbi:MAG TPA: hypothetical protein PK340_02305 [Bacilli bacterium]|nr:hypothetical protein [Bacilli bacterium]
MHKNNIIIALTLSAIILSSCQGSNSTSEIDIDSLGYQWTDTSAPIIATKDAISFDVLSPKNALADNYDDMKVFNDLNDSTNVKISWRNLSESAYAAQKTLIMSDRNNYPDAIYHAGFSDKEIIQYSSRKVIIPLDEYFDKMPNLSAILEKRPDVRRMLTAPDGHIYTLPKVEEMGLMPYPNLLFVNKSWIADLITANLISFLTINDLNDGLNLTLEQFRTILSLFKTEDMNKNGKNDEIPLSFVYQNWQGNYSDLYATFGIPENINHLTVLDGNITFTATDSKWREATNYFYEWVRDGLIDREIFSQTQDFFLAKGKATDQRLGAFYWWESETVVKNPEDYIVLNPLIGLQGQQYIGVSNNQEMTRGEFVVFSKAAHPEILLTYMDRYYDPIISAQINYGPIGIVFEEELDEHGKLVQKPLPQGMTADELRLKNAPLGCFYLSYEEWENVINMEPRARLRLERLDDHAIPFVYPGASPIPNITYTMTEINALSTIELNLNSYVYEQQTQWLLNGGPSESQFNTFKNTLNNIGLQEALAIYQAAYNRYIAEFE